MDFDLRLIRYFVAVADELHFGRAAARLYISQPALSKQIRRLEATVGEPLLVRDSRHVRLTPRGLDFLDGARRLLTVAEGMSRPRDPNVVRLAHIFELTTSRDVADAFAAANPNVEVIERSMDSARQLTALLANHLDVAILRVTRRMVAEHPTGWQHRLLRLEPLLLVGRPTDPHRETVSLRERPVTVFADTPGSGMYNVHGEYVSAFERDTGITLRWLGNPGTFNNCLAAVMRSPEPAFLLDFSSYTERYAEVGLPVHRPLEHQPLYPWSIAWRDEQLSEPVAEVVRTALALARRRGWTSAPVGPAPPWLPPDDPSNRGPGRAD
jgi:DNA-binding transcriptional LysR family regulator